MALIETELPSTPCARQLREKLEQAIVGHTALAQADEGRGRSSFVGRSPFVRRRSASAATDGACGTPGARQRTRSGADKKACASPEALRERLADAEQMLTYPFLEQLLFSGPQVARISPDLPRHPPISPISHDLPRSLMISHDLALLWPAQACASISAHVLEWSRLPSFVDINLRLLAAPLVRRPRTALRYDLPPPPIFTTLH